MSRIQLALNVSDIKAATTFYSKLFGTTPAKERPGYANFAIADPPLKLILFEAPGKGGSVNHLGVELFSSEELTAAAARLAESGLSTRPEERVDCCYATQDKVWATGPDGEEWEHYTVLADSEQAVPSECVGVAPEMKQSAACC